MGSLKDVLATLKELKPRFAKEGVEILGVFGSVARDEANSLSDIDILIETHPEFLEKYRGFLGFAKLEEMKQILEQTFERQVDIVDKQGLLQHKNEYILKKAIYV